MGVRLHVSASACVGLYVLESIKVFLWYRIFLVEFHMPAFASVPNREWQALCAIVCLVEFVRLRVCVKFGLSPCTVLYDCKRVIVYKCVIECLRLHEFVLLYAALCAYVRLFVFMCKCASVFVREKCFFFLMSACVCVCEVASHACACMHASLRECLYSCICVYLTLRACVFVCVCA